MKRTALALCLAACVAPVLASELVLTDIPRSPREQPLSFKPDQLPQSLVTRGTRDIAAAWLARPTNRYNHGVLGDGLEAARVTVETPAGQQVHLDLPEHRVFEDLMVRLADLDQDGRDEMLVVESDASDGAALAVYGLENSRIVLRGRTPFIGRAWRWLNPVGVGDFDGDGRLDIALVSTPHIGGILRLYRYTPPNLALFAETDGVSTHRMGSPELGLGQVIQASPRDRLLLPDQMQQSLLLLEWAPEGFQIVARTMLPGRMRSSLFPAGAGRWRFELDGGRQLEVRVTD